MRGRLVTNPFALCLLWTGVGLLASPLAAQNNTKGKLVVGNTSIEITRAYAYAAKGFTTGEDTVEVLLCDAPVPGEAIQDESARKKLVAAGTLHYVEVLVDSKQQALHYEVQHQRFGMMMQPGGDDSDHVVEVKTFDGTTIAGRAHTLSTQQTLEDVPYSYDITFSAQIAPMKQP